MDHSAERVLLRTVRCLQGAVDFVLECEPAFDYGRHRGTWRHTGSGYGQAEVSGGEAGPLLRLTTDLNVGFEGPRAIARRRLRAGERVFCTLSWGDGTPPETFGDAHQRLARTADFWLVSALTEIGEVARARALCEKLLCYASPLFLYAEEIDPHSGRHLGNFPQAFSHLALINAVMHLIREDERRSASGSEGPGPATGPAGER